MRVGRRTVIAGLGVGTLAASAGAFSAQRVLTGDVRVRREASDLETNFLSELDRYRRAVAAMRKSRAGSTAWERNAQSHASVCGERPQDVHYTWFFLPWHRAYLWATEQNLQFAIGDDKVALPYWHWPVKGAVPSAFLSGELAHPRQRTTLEAFEYDFATGMKATRYVGAFTVQPNGRPLVTTLGFGGYTAESYISSSLEGVPHGAIHNVVGGRNDMGNIKWSPRDPVFYAHHSNLDRLWEVWRGPAGSANRTTEPWDNPAFSNRTFSFYDLKAGGIRTVWLEQVKETSDLGYRYAPPGERADESVGIATAGGTAGSAPGPDPNRLGSPVARGEAAIVTSAVATSSEPGPKKRALLTVQGVDIPRNRGSTLAIYLVNRTEKDFDVGSAIFAGATAVVRQPTATTVNLVLDITDALAAARIEDGKVGIVVAPIDDKVALPLEIEGYRISVTND